MIYFDNVATSLPKPKEVIEAVTLAMKYCGNPSRGAHQAALTGLRTLITARQTIAQFFGVANAQNIAFTPTLPQL